MMSGPHCEPALQARQMSAGVMTGDGQSRVFLRPIGIMYPFAFGA